MTKYIIDEDILKKTVTKVKNIKNNGDVISISSLANEIRNLSPKNIEDFLDSSPVDGTTSTPGIYKSFKEIPWISSFDNFTESASAKFQGYNNIINFPSIKIKSSNTSNMFDGCTSLEIIGEVGIYDVTTASSMFRGCSKLQEINFDNHSTKINASYMFSGCSSLKKITGLQGLKISNGTYMFQSCSSLEEIPACDYTEMTSGLYMFTGCSSLKHLSNTSFPKMTEGNYMFENCANIDNLKDIQCPILQTGTYMFRNCTQLTEVMPTQDTLTGMYGMYEGCTGITNIIDFNKEKITSAGYLFNKCSGLTEVGEMIFPKSTEVGYIFANCSNLIKCGGIEAGSDITSTVSNAYTHFFEKTPIQEVGYIKLPKVASFYSQHSSDSIFYGATTTIKKVGDVILSSLANGRYIFEDCKVLEEIGNIDLSSATSAEYLFTGCANLTKIGNISFTKIQNCSYMFNNCTSLVDFPSFDMSTATSTNNMFYNCIMEYVPESFNAENVTSASYTFQSCKQLKEANISLPKATTITYIFNGCSSLEKVKIRDIENILYWNYAFRNCSALTEITLQGRLAEGIVTTNMFEGVSKNGVLYYDGRYDYSAIIAVLPSTWTAVSTYTPTECVELHITADNVKAKQTQTTIYWTAITNGIEGESGERMEGIEVTGTALSEPFEQNTSYDEVAIREISFTYMGVTATTTIEQATWVDSYYTIDLNNEWRLSSTVTNPDTALYDGVYESYESKGKDNSGDSMFITIEGYNNFKFYIRSYAESNYDYVMVGQLDQNIDYNTSYSNSTLVKAHTRGTQNSGTTISNYKLVEFTNIDGGEHTIEIVYRKDGSQSSGTDAGYVLIPYEQ